MANVSEQIDAVKSNLTGPAPTLTELPPQASPQDLQARLNWGEPALTIIDVRDRTAYNQERIQGAISMPRAELLPMIQGSLESTRDIYIYGDNDDDTAAAAEQLRQAGFTRVVELKDGLAGWQAISAPTEGNA
ncbi:Rhodanese-like protein [Halomicronema hongdechloris C2206]|uniref:Rhodanese-like protein n=1 Tax=Halomicronema hongdechloris C2206 TaxID=1641165 RepID=A0A1Z3HIH0_9CYAN|nr:rhodanese-like domain-containing protein [Halomicronema hongdechloris]ASC70119.1 Rhodanese-like protein [Halomicronema hongdechloris C2206]